VRPLITEENLKKHPRAQEIITMFDKIFQDNDLFISEYEGLFPAKQRDHIDIIFSHNDLQEGNALVKHEDKS
jgi:thiamine kinase-like enzyme